MLIPEINPDEFGPGYMIRLGLCNGLKNQARVSNAIKDYLRNIDITTDLITVQLAVLLDINIEQFCQQHTLLPIYRGLTNIEPEITHGSMNYPYAIKRYGHFGFVKQFKVCRACMAEDLDYLGYSYYRRSHQIPGAQVCTKHHDLNEGNLLKAPSGLFVNPNMIDSCKLENIQIFKNPVIDRLHDIFNGLCDFNIPIFTVKIIDQLQFKAREKNLRWSSDGTKKLFSDLVLEQLPLDWLIEYLPTFKRKIKEKRHSCIDAILSPQMRSFQSPMYVLAMAILYDDADEALLMLNMSTNFEQRTIQPVRRFNQDYWGSNVIKKMYLEHGGSMTAISKQLGVNTELVSAKLKSEGLPSVKGLSSKVIDGFLLFTNGASLYEAAIKSGSTEKELESIIRGGCTKLSNLIGSMQTHHASLN